MMLQSMRKATERSGLLDSHATETYEQMFDQELSMHLSKTDPSALPKRSRGKLDSIKIVEWKTENPRCVRSTKQLPLTREDEKACRFQEDK